MDFVLYGERGLHALEVKRTATFRESDLAALRKFKDDYPVAQCRLLYLGKRRYELPDGLQVVPVTEALPALPALLCG